MSRLLPALLALLIHVGITTYFVLGALPHLNPTIRPPEKTAIPAKIWNFHTEAVDNLITELKAEREKLEEERKALAGDIKDIYAEAKSAGFDVKVLRQLIRVRKQEPSDVEEQETLLDVYRRALGICCPCRQFARRLRTHRPT